MEDFIQGRSITWIPRIGFTMLLLCFGELVPWYQAGTYSVLDWLVVALIYLALAAITLDLLVRWQTTEWPTVFFVAAVFGLLHSSLVTLGLFQNLPLSLAFYATGVQTLMYLLAYGSFRFLYSGKIAVKWLYGLAPIVGITWGIWTRWFPKLDAVQLPVPALGETLPYTVLGLLFSALVVFYLPLTTEITRDDWLLLPFEWASSAIVIFVLFIMRLEGGYLPLLGVVVVAIILTLVVMMLWFSQKTQPDRSSFRIVIRPQRELLIQWVLMIFPFSLMAWVGYRLPGTGNESIQATVLFGLLVIFGILWLPLFSIQIGVRAFMELGRQEF